MKNVDELTLRDYFAIHAPQPDKDRIELHSRLDKTRNPHNDTWHPRIRSNDEIVADLRYEFADAMIETRNRVRAK